MRLQNREKTKEFLNNFTIFKAKIEDIKLEFEEIKTNFGEKSVTFEEKISETYQKSSPVEVNFFEKEAKITQLELKKHSFEIKIKRIENAISALRDKNMQKIIELRYIKTYKMSWEQVSFATNLSVSTCQKYEAEALDTIGIILYDLIEIQDL